MFSFKSVYAEIIRSFDAEIVAHKDGTMDIKENILYDFENENRHGIFRNIPLITKVGNLYRVTEIDFNEVLRDGQSEKFVNQSSKKLASVKIGKANVEITGSHTYTISYKVKNGIGSNYRDHDEIYWNITGNNWDVPILKVLSNLATDFGQVPNKATCYTGTSVSKEKNCNSTLIAIITTEELGPNEGLTSVWGFPKNTFPPSILQKENPSAPKEISGAVLAAIFLGIPILLNLILAPALFIWYWKKKRKKSLGSPPVNFDIPKDVQNKRITPAEAGSIDIHLVDKNDVIATIFDLTIRKYVKIEEVKKKKALGIFGDGNDYLVTKMPARHRLSPQAIAGGKSYDDLEKFEQILLDKLFEKGDSVELSSLSTDFYKTFNMFSDEVFKSHVAKGFYVKNPKLQMQSLLVFGVIIFFFAPILGGVLVYLSRKLNGRTKPGDEIDFKIDGLKIFLKNMKKNYKWQADKLYIVENLIPYAIAFGYIKEFMEQIKVIYPNYSPTWYHGNIAFYSMSNSMFSSFNSSFTTSAPSSSSGFGGGGFSGGGGGGGGGGSW